MTPELQQRLINLRGKAVDGSLSIEEMKEAVRLMRGDRASAVKNSDSSRRKMAKAEIPDADSLLDELGNI
jgi:hypothetical protein